MDHNAYQKLAKVLDTLPNGFPSTKSGVEIKLLKKIYTPDEADLFCDLKLHLETADQIAKRTQRPIKGLEEQLISLWQKGGIWGQEAGGVKSFKMVPFIIGIYEFQLKRLDREFCELLDAYQMDLGINLVGFAPSLMQVIPIEKNIMYDQKALPYQLASKIIENGKSFMVNECICRKKQKIMDKPCQKPNEVCLAISDEEGALENQPMGGRILTKSETLDVLKKAEEAGLVHLTTNVQKGHWFICNCCGCCCAMLQTVRMGIPNVVNSHYYAQINPDLCTACGSCMENRCQVKAIKEKDGVYYVRKERCIGCGVCISACPTEAITLAHKPENEYVHPPMDEMAWFDERAKNRGVDISLFK
jgi:Na+-translocating ferredoxin:NAD+ oxidoreductase subunit B